MIGFTFHGIWSIITTFFRRGRGKEKDDLMVFTDIGSRIAAFRQKGISLEAMERRGR
ncbi:hypothetical protein [Gracilibacillus sp. Marseille-QA3620]